MLLFTITLIILLCILLSKNNNTFIVSCNSKTDNLCKMYNHKDISSTCSALCKSKVDNALFINEYSKKNNIYSCTCSTIQHVEHLSNIKDITNILPQEIPTDVLYSDRNYVEQQNESRLKKLIFG